MERDQNVNLFVLHILQPSLSVLVTRSEICFAPTSSNSALSHTRIQLRVQASFSNHKHIRQSDNYTIASIAMNKRLVFDVRGVTCWIEISYATCSFVHSRAVPRKVQTYNGRTDSLHSAYPWLCRRLLSRYLRVSGLRVWHPVTWANDTAFEVATISLVMLPRRYNTRA